MLEQIRDQSDAHLIQTVTLRSLAQAVYSPANVGHFGLALDAYAHFTSPIRHPDCRCIAPSATPLTGATGGVSLTPVDLVGLGEHCSMTERRADEAFATRWNG